MAGKSFFGRIMGRNQSETQAAVPMSQVNSAPQDDKTYEFNTRLGSSYLNVVNYGASMGEVGVLLKRHGDDSY